MSIIIPSAESDRKKIKDAMTEISNSMTRIDAEVGIDKKYLKRLANTYHRQNLVEVTTEADDLQSLYETCLK